MGTYRCAYRPREFRDGVLVAFGIAAVAVACAEGGSSTTGPDPNPTGSTETVLVTAVADSVLAGGVLQLVAEARDRSGRVLAGKQFSWASSDSLLLQVNSAGSAAGRTPGQATVSASVDGKRGEKVIRVVAVPVASVAVSATLDSVTIGDTLRLSATVRNAEGQPLAGRQVTWTSRNTGVATVDGSGLVRAVSAGAVPIVASSEGKSDSVTIRAVAPRPVASVRVSLRSAVILAGAAPESAEAFALAANGDTLRGRDIAWMSTSPAVATIDGSGRISALIPGQADVVATIEGRTARATITVEPRSKYERTFNDQWAFIDGSDPRMPAWDAGRQGYVPGAMDQREQVVIDESFSVPAGREVLWDNKIVWVRPSQRKDILIAGKLTVRNSLLLWDQTEHQQTKLDVQRGGTLQIDNSYAFTSDGLWVNWEFRDGATVSYDHFQGEPWTSLHGTVNYRAANASTVRMTIFGNVEQSRVAISDAQSVFLEMFLPTGTHQIDRIPDSFAWRTVEWNTIWPGTTVQVVNSYYQRADVALDNDTHVTVTNSLGGFGVGWTIRNASNQYVECELRDFGVPNYDPSVRYSADDRGTVYADKTWTLPCTNSSLTLRNSRLLPSWPNVLGAVRLKVYNSNMVDVRNYGSGAAPYPTFEIYDSSLFLLSTTSGGQTYIENSLVHEDVQVNGQGSVVYGYRLRAPGGSSPRVSQESGGRYVELAAPGAPWR